MRKLMSSTLSGMRQSGMTLLEVLIALLVLSIGMVGLGALLITALTNVHSSSQYSLSSALALDFEERLWFEISTLSANSPDLLSNGCLTIDQINDVANHVDVGMVTQWSQAGASWNWTTDGAQRFRVQGLSVDEITPANVSHTEVSNADNELTGIRWQKLESVVIRWDEGRFDLENGEVVEIAIGLVCRPIF